MITDLPDDPTEKREETVNQEEMNLFFEELGDNLDGIEETFIVFESDPKNLDCITRIFCYFHNIKSTAKSVHFNELAEYCHQCENLLSEMREGRLTADQDLVDLFLKSTDYIRNNYKLSPDGIFINHTFEKLKPETATLKEIFETFKSYYKESDKKVEFKAKQPIIASRSVGKIKVLSSKIDDLLQLVEKQDELIKNIYLKQSTEEIHVLKELSEVIVKNTISLKKSPLNPLFDRLKRIVRDVARSTGKEVDFIKQHGEIEVDRNIVDNLSGPLTHMVINSVDHGIEQPKERERLGKKRTGSIWITAFISGDKLELSVEDNGKGLDTDRILEKAIKMGLTTIDSKLTSQEIHKFIFESGFSTKESVSELSGRGVGMDVVHKQIMALKGKISIESRAGRGTKISLIFDLN